MTARCNIVRGHRPRLQQHDALARDFDPAAAPGIRTTDDVIGSNHIIARVFEARTILLVSPGRKSRFLRSPDPANLIVGNLLARRAAQRLRLRFGFLREKLPFIHNLHSPFAAIPGIVMRMGSRISFSLSLDRIFFSRAICRTVFPVLWDSLAIAAAAS